jgi:putative membrane protein
MPRGGYCVKKQNSFLFRIFKGFIIGIAAILPGASGGVLAVAMGIYKPTLDALASIFKSFKASVRFLLPLGLGALLGLLSTSQMVEYLMLNFREQTMFALIGLVAGGVPSLISEANAHGFKKRYLFASVFGVGFVILFAVLNNSLTGTGSWPFNEWTSMLGGGILAVGTVIPGISTSFLLIHMGLYEPLLSALNDFDIVTLLCIAAGAVGIAAILVLFVKRMFERHYGYAYYAVLGFLIGSIVLVFPGITWGVTALIDILLLLSGTLGSYFLCKKPAES